MPSPYLAAPDAVAQQLGSSPVLSWALWAVFAAALVAFVVGAIWMAVKTTRYTCVTVYREAAVMAGSALIAAVAVAVSRVIGTSA